MKTISAKELRIKTAEALEEARKGHEVTVTVRGKPVAVLKPLPKEERVFRRRCFGIWKDRDDMANPGRWVEERRSERENRSDTL
jgi:prevent-host-death family protein